MAELVTSNNLKSRNTDLATHFPKKIKLLKIPLPLLFFNLRPNLFVIPFRVDCCMNMKYVSY